MDFPPDESHDKEFSHSGNNITEESFPFLISHFSPTLIRSLHSSLYFVDGHVMLNRISSNASYDIASYDKDYRNLEINYNNLDKT